MVILTTAMSIAISILGLNFEVVVRAVAVLRMGTRYVIMVSVSVVEKNSGISFVVREVLLAV